MTTPVPVCPHARQATEIARSGDEETWQTWCLDCGARLPLDPAQVTRPAVVPTRVVME